MKYRRIISIIGLVAAVLVTPAWGLDVLETKTEARIHPLDPTTTVIELNFKAHLMNNGFSDLPFVDVVLESQKPGGIDPQPFRILIPADCFMLNRVFRVDDFRSCRVQMTYDLGRGPIAVSIMDFEARLTPQSDGSANFAVETRFTDLGQEPAILGALGGAAVEIAIGVELGTALPNAVETLGGVDPIPF